MHMVIPEIGVVGSSGIVGAGIPIATGLGLASDVKQSGQVIACFFGDGASNTGTFHEAVNLAAAWKLPVVFVCENNLYGISVPFKKVSLIENVADRACGYGIPGVIVDGMDVIAVYKAAQQAVKRAREGKGPTLLECKTYRFRGHFEGDPKRGGTYRSENEMKKWEEKGKTEKAEELLEKAEEVVPETPVVIAMTEKPKGVSYSQKWMAEVIDIDKVPREYLIPNMQALNGIAQSTKGTIQIPGVKFLSEKILSSRAG